ncbi:hypothetical protein LOAG_03342 [Loa loa]|uniref:Uncharacterized protein n=1 Tax=Loa loa TaxID=7209 RepID=A0A1S0U4M2_LOALO|nr:hypothetical protein LOAG_03342 [Loa loa]EFO25147.2 hypothetical protein LOAG_03342 [Loa loa]
MLYVELYSEQEKDSGHPADTTPISINSNPENRLKWWIDGTDYNNGNQNGISSSIRDIKKTIYLQYLLQ